LSGEVAIYSDPFSLADYIVVEQPVRRISVAFYASILSRCPVAGQQDVGIRGTEVTTCSPNLLEVASKGRRGADVDDIADIRPVEALCEGGSSD